MKKKVVKRTSFLRSFFKFAVRNYLIVIFMLAVGFVIMVSFVKIVFSKDHYIYAQVQMAPGLWWVRSAKPNAWHALAIQKGDVEVGLLGKPAAEVVAVRRYPWYSSDEYNVFLTVKLKVGRDKKRGTYMFKRAAIAVGSPVELEFSRVQLTGIITELSKKKITRPLIKKRVTIIKAEALPSEYDTVIIGDSYNDGTQEILQVVDKSAVETYGLYSMLLPFRKNITLTLNLWVKQEKNGQLLFAEDQFIRLGKGFTAATAKTQLEGYKVIAIE